MCESGEGNGKSDNGERINIAYTINETIAIILFRGNLKKMLGTRGAQCGKWGIFAYLDPQYKI